MSFALETPQAASGHWHMLASTLGVGEQDALLAELPLGAGGAQRMVINLSGVDHQALMIPLDENDNARIVAVLHRSLGGALAAFERLRNTLIVLALLSIVMSIVGSIAVARSITHPLETLASVATRIAPDVDGADLRMNITAGR